LLQPGGVTGRRRLRRRLALLALAAAALVVLVPAAQQAAATHTVGGDLLPDLQVNAPTALEIRTTSAGARQLWFATGVVNTHSGPLELIPRAEDCNGNGDTTDDRTAYQRIYRDADSNGFFTRATDAGSRDVRAGCMLFHAAHNHWHFDDFARYELRPYNVDGSLGAVVRTSDKVSFCVADEHRRVPELPGSPNVNHYPKLDTGCGQNAVMGLSVGWGDDYDINRDGQWLDVTGLPDGPYCLVSTADPTNQVAETNDANNMARIKVTLSGASVSWQPYEPCLPADTVAPDTTLASGPADPSASSSARFVFGGTASAYRFECSLDGAAFAPCAAPKDYAGLAGGGHTFAVRAVDVFGNTDQSPATWRWSIAAPSAPANDNFASAQALSGAAGSVGADTTSATRETGEPLIVGNAGGHSVWYTWTAVATGPTTLDTIGSAYDTTLAVYSGSSLTALTKLAEDDDAAGNRLSRVSFAATAGVVYRVQVDGYRGTSGPAWYGALKLNWSFAAAPPPPPPPSGAPANDNFANALLVSGASGSVAGDTTHATRETGEPLIVGNAGGRSVWFRWTANATRTVTVDTIGSAFDTTLAVYTGSTLTALTRRAQDDDSGGNRTSRVSFAATAGVVYRIQIDGYRGTSGPAWYGALKLNWR